MSWKAVVAWFRAAWRAVKAFPVAARERIRRSRAPLLLLSLLRALTTGLEVWLRRPAGAAPTAPADDGRQSDQAWRPAALELPPLEPPPPEPPLRRPTPPPVPPEARRTVSVPAPAPVPVPIPARPRAVTPIPPPAARSPLPPVTRKMAIAPRPVVPPSRAGLPTGLPRGRVATGRRGLG